MKINHNAKPEFALKNTLIQKDELAKALNVFEQEEFLLSSEIKTFEFGKTVGREVSIYNQKHHYMLHILAYFQKFSINAPFLLMKQPEGIGFYKVPYSNRIPLITSTHADNQEHLMFTVTKQDGNGYKLKTDYLNFCSYVGVQSLKYGLNKKDQMHSADIVPHMAIVALELAGVDIGMKTIDGDTEYLNIRREEFNLVYNN